MVNFGGVIKSMSKADVSAESERQSSRLSNQSLAWRLRHLLFLVFLQCVEGVLMAPIVPYLLLTFFAASHGGGNCELTPSSAPCQKAASDAAIYNGVSSGVCSFAAAVWALGLGSYSDKIGRRPLFRARSIIAIFPGATLALYLSYGVSLWVFLVVSPVFRSVDISGVLLAFISDIVMDPEERAAAVGLFFLFAIVIIVALLPLAGMLPASTAIGISLGASAVKIIFNWTVLPETMQTMQTLQSNKDDSENSVYAHTRIREMFSGNKFLQIMAGILIVSSLSTAATNTILTPYLTAFLGLTRIEGTKLLALSFVSGAAGLAIAVKPLVRAVGQVGALRICLFFQAIYPLLLPFCSDTNQLSILIGMLCPPMFMLAAIISGLKSNLVGPDEQGLVQGVLASVANFATAFSDVVFGFLYSLVTEGGSNTTPSSTFPLFFSSSCLGFCALVLAILLPQSLPFSTQRPVDGTAAPLLQA
eukprot:TRINITY_DN64813_c0_g1_i1.p1 TRINITY_DN64813_c0_g1~~TRINITY_DN64813_c0_g1_i1.p1  ORF type:complete len:475 (-),score=43.71 TRINITY_DN64813_c0_g1_i1:48-1472(-)